MPLEKEGKKRLRPFFPAPVKGTVNMEAAELVLSHSHRGTL